MAEQKVDDKTIFKAFTDFKALSEPELEEILGYSKNGLYNRLHSLTMKKKVYCKKIPTLGTSTNLRVLQRYQGLRVYSLNEKLFKEWLISQMPKKIAPLYKRLFTTIVHDLGLEIDMPQSTTKRQLWIYDREVYAFLVKTAEKKQQNISKTAEEMIRKQMRKKHA